MVRLISIYLFFCYVSISIYSSDLLREYVKFICLDFLGLSFCAVGIYNGLDFSKSCNHIFMPRTYNLKLIYLPGLSHPKHGFFSLVYKIWFHKSRIISYLFNVFHILFVANFFNLLHFVL